MHFLRLLGLVLIIVGFIMLIGGVIWYRSNTGAFAEGPAALVLLGILFMLGAIVVLIFGFDHETPDPVQQVHDDIQTGRLQIA
jgi:hypothetical protein